MSNRVIDINESRIYVGSDALSELQEILEKEDYKESSKFVLVDECSLRSCLPHLLAKVPALKNAEVIEIESGELNKNIEICAQIWTALSEMEADRHSTLINLGGGVITDMGGFIASCYMRGIRFFNIPTTLLAQVDASLGGKTGVDLGRLKNLVGVFNDPQGVFITPEFLRSLGKRQLLAGFAEMLKHALIADADYWDTLKALDFSSVDELTEPIIRSIEIKKEIVLQDPKEGGLRKALNFGHTIGHAIESFSLESQQKALLHGEAVAIGMVCEAYLSAELGQLSKEELENITDVILGYYEPYPMEEIVNNRIVEIMRHDKKNRGDELNFTFLTGIGDCEVNQTATANEVIGALNYYRVLANQRMK